MPETLFECSEEFLIYLGSVRGLSENTLLSYRQDLAHFCEFFGNDKSAEELTLEDLRLLLDI